MRVMSLITTILSALVLFSPASASAFDVFRIVDHLGNLILQDPAASPHEMASLKITNCARQQTGNILTLQCPPEQLYEGIWIGSPFFTTTATGVRGCTDMPYPLIEYIDPVPCFTMTYNTNTAPIHEAGTRLCTAAQPWSNISPCIRAHQFVAAPTAPGGLVLSKIVVAYGLAGFGGPTRPCLEPASSRVCTVHPPVDGSTYPHAYVTVVYAPAPPTISCRGFQSPFDQTLAFSKSNRVIPLKAQLFNLSNVLVTPGALNAAPPIVEVFYAAGANPGIDAAALLTTSGQSSTGNQFNFDSATSTWWFNLASASYTAPGTYTVKLNSGDATKYLVNPNCTGTFVRQ